MTVNVFMVVALRQFPKLPVESLPAGVVHPRSTPAVPPPISETLHKFFQGRMGDNIYRTSLPHGHVVGGIKRLGGKISPGASVTGDVNSIRRNAG